MSESEVNAVDVIDAVMSDQESIRKILLEIFDARKKFVAQCEENGRQAAMGMFKFPKVEQARADGLYECLLRVAAIDVGLMFKLAELRRQRAAYAA